MPRKWNLILVVCLVAALMPRPAMGRSRQGDKLLARARLAELKDTSKGLDEALKLAEEALATDRSDIRYQLEVSRLRAFAAQYHVYDGQVARDKGQIKEAVAEFEKAKELEAASLVAPQELERTKQLANELRRNPSANADDLLMRPLPRKNLQDERMFSNAAPVAVLTVKLAKPLPVIKVNNQSAADVFQTVCREAKVRVLFDPEFQPYGLGLNQTLDFRGTSLETALDHVALVATSALDSATEAMINSTIERVSKGRTVLSVTHRLGSAVNADRTFFLDKGRVVEQGTHAELLQLDGAYARLWGKQSGFAIDASDGQARVTPERLRGIPILADVEEGILAELARSFRTEHCAQGQFVFHEGDSGDKFYVVVRGTLEVVKLTGGQATRRVEVLQDGDVFGEQALLMNAPRSASVRSLAESTLLVLTADKFQELIARVPEVRWKLRESATIGEYRNDEAASGIVSPWSKFRHDLITPVNHILGYSEMLAEEFTEVVDAELHSHALQIHGAGQALHNGIDAELPSGRTPAPGVIGALRQRLQEPLDTVDTAAAQLREHVPATGQTAEDIGRIVFAARRLRSMLNETDSVGAAPRLTAEESDAPSRPGGDAGHILVVDDNDAGRDLLSRKLERDGHRVSSAANGAMALEMAAATQFDLALLDVMMPDIDGIEVLQRWRATGVLERLPVIVTSALDGVESAVRCIELGAEDYLTKPFDPVLLRARIRTSVEKKRLRDRERARAQQLPPALEHRSEKGQAAKL